jgi:fatty acid desaturase
MIHPNTLQMGGVRLKRAMTLQDTPLKETLQRLRRTDNFTNLYYLARTYGLLAVVICGTIWFYHYQGSHGLSWWWNVPMVLFAVVVVGAGQHQLAGLAHEASHHTLLRHRLANDLVSDWLCMFPLFSTTHHYRLQHLAHHQFVNDPELDPDVSQLRESGHWLPFPLSPRQALWAMLREARPLRLLKYIAIRSRYSSMASPTNPYARNDMTPSRLPVRVGILYLFGLAMLLTLLVHYGDPILLAVIPTAAWLAVAAFYQMIPAGFYQQVRFRPIISIRALSIGRVTFITLLFNCLAWITWATGERAALWFGLLWIVPLATSFSWFMILRQIVQHGNGGRGWLTNTRIFLVHRLIRFSVFPLGQDYHLPHHLFSSVPHYRLRELHEALLPYPEYRQQAVVVHGYFLPPHPTVLDVLGPAYALPASIPAHIDDTVLEGEQLDDGGGGVMAGSARL